MHRIRQSDCSLPLSKKPLLDPQAEEEDCVYVMTDRSARNLAWQDGLPGADHAPVKLAEFRGSDLLGLPVAVRFLPPRSARTDMPTCGMVASSFTARNRGGALPDGASTHAHL